MAGGAGNDQKSRFVRRGVGTFGARISGGGTSLKRTRWKGKWGVSGNRPSFSERERHGFGSRSLSKDSVAKHQQVEREDDVLGVME